MQIRDNVRLKNGWLSTLCIDGKGSRKNNFTFYANPKEKNAEKRRHYESGRYVRHGFAFETFIDWALDCLFMALILVLVIMTTLAYGL